MLSVYSSVECKRADIDCSLYYLYKYNSRKHADEREAGTVKSELQARPIDQTIIPTASHILSYERKRTSRRAFSLRDAFLEARAVACGSWKEENGTGGVSETLFARAELQGALRPGSQWREQHKSFPSPSQLGSSSLSLVFLPTSRLRTPLLHQNSRPRNGQTDGKGERGS
jgi:hypothetical protein